MPSRTFKLTISDEDLAAWMVINNTFTRDNLANWNTRRHYWNGVLLQLGGYQSIAGNYMFLLSSVVLKYGNHVVTEVTRSEWEQRSNRIWINIIAGQARGRPDPMKLQHLNRILPNPPMSLHKYFWPYPGGITLWQDRQSPYRMTARTLGNYHDYYSFETLKGYRFRVEIYGRAHPVTAPWQLLTTPERYTNVDQVLITALGGGDHGDHNNPPQR